MTLTDDALLNKLLWTPLKRTAEFVWCTRSRFSLLNVPVPWRLPYGAWFLAYGDTMGARICGYHLSRRPYEEGQWKFVCRFLKTGMTFFDIGANQGFYTILAAKRVGSQGKVFAFEPAPTEYRKLRRNLLMNRCQNVVMESQAVGAYEGLTEFYMCFDHQGSFSSIRHPAEDVISRKKLIEVPITTLDLYIQNNNISSMDFMKLDVEGGELDVLKGAGGVLTKLRPLVLCEVADIRTRQWGYKASELCEFLAGYGYIWVPLRSDGTPSSGRTEGNVPDCDSLLGVPGEKLKDIG